MNRYTLFIVAAVAVTFGGFLTPCFLIERNNSLGRERASAECPYRQGDVVRVKLTGEKALVVDIRLRIVSARTFSESTCEAWLYIRTAQHYGEGGQWKVRAAGFGGSTGGSRRAWVRVRPSEVEPWEEKR